MIKLGRLRSLFGDPRLVPYVRGVGPAGHRVSLVIRAGPHMQAFVLGKGLREAECLR